MTFWTWAHEHWFLTFVLGLAATNVLIAAFNALGAMFGRRE